MVGWLEARPQRRSMAVSGRREGQVRAAAGGRAGRRGLRLAGGLGWGRGRDNISEPGRWCRGRGDEGRRSSSVERGCSWGCLNCSPHAPPRGPRGWRTAWAGGEHRAVTLVPSCRPAGRESLARKGVCWGRTTDGDCSGGSWASDGQGEAAEPQLHQPARTRGEETPSHRCPHSRSPAVPPSLLVQITFTAPTLPFLLGGGTNTPISSQRWHLQHLEQTVPLPFARSYLYIQGAR